MTIYHQLGEIPHKRHTVFEKQETGIHYEQLFGTEGFSGMSSLLYHLHRPTMIQKVGHAQDVQPVAAVNKNIKPYMLKGFDIPSISDFLESRKVVLFNNDVHIALSAPSSNMSEYFYKNADADEVIFVHQGSGTLRTMLGNIPFAYGDYLVIPRGMIYQIDFNDENNRLFIVESFSPVVTPHRYRNEFGQL